MTLHSGTIGGVPVAGYRYVVYGTARGLVSTHRTKRASLRSLALDARARMAAGTPSDAGVYHWKDGWAMIGESEVVELVTPPPEPGRA